MKNRYRIERMVDILQLDDRQLDDFVKDLKMWVNFRKNLDSQINFAKDALLNVGVTNISDYIKAEIPDYIDWIDDGKNEGIIKYRVADIDSGNHIDSGTFTIRNNGEVNHD
jgi:hypothetical protein